MRRVLLLFNVSARRWILNIFFYYQLLVTLNLLRPSIGAVDPFNGHTISKSVVLIGQVVLLTFLVIDALSARAKHRLFKIDQSPQQHSVVISLG